MFQNKWKLTAISLALVIVLLASCFVILYKPQAVAAKEPMLLDVSIEGKAKLNVDEFSNYKVNVVGGVGELSYDWSFTPADGKARFYDNGATASIIFKNATDEPYLLEVKVYDEAGNFGVASMAIYDPPTFPSTYLGVYGAPYSYMIKADGTGWYYAINGNTGAVSWSSTNGSYVIQSALDSLPSNPTEYAKINIKGNIILTNTLIINNYTVIDGSGGGKLTFDYTEGFCTISSYQNWIDDGTITSFVTLQNLIITSLNNDAPILLYGNYISIDHCTISNHTALMLKGMINSCTNSYFTAVTNGLLFQNCNGSFISKNTFTEAVYGVNFNGVQFSPTVINNAFINLDYGVHMGSDTYNLMILPQSFNTVGDFYSFDAPYYNCTILDPVNGEWLLNVSS